jgi:hypothetical protein
VSLLESYRRRHVAVDASGLFSKSVWLSKIASELLVVAYWMPMVWMKSTTMIVVSMAADTIIV